MGAVYQARQRQLDRLVALKILPAEVSHDPAFAERFMREARALARLGHSNIVAVHDFGQADGFYYFLMEFIDGVTLRHLLAEGKLEPREALAIVPQICEALQYAHDQGVVHRDIKPENILLDKAGRVKIADFGLARLVGTDMGSRRLTQPREVMGTPHYMAPEQVEKPQFVDHRADIYSLGVVFYEMLTGELPLGRFASPSQKVQVDVRLDEVVLRALEKEPERRYQQASQVRTDLDSIALTSSSESVTQGTKGNMKTRSHKTLWFGIGIGLACPVLVLVIYLFAAKRGDGDPSSQLAQAAQLWASGRPAEAIPMFEQAEKWAQMIVDSGQGDNGARALLQAAKDKKLSDGLQFMIEPP